MEILRPRPYRSWTSVFPIKLPIIGFVQSIDFSSYKPYPQVRTIKMIWSIHPQGFGVVVRAQQVMCELDAHHGFDGFESLMLGFERESIHTKRNNLVAPKGVG